MKDSDCTDVNYMADSEDFATTEASKPIRLKFAIAIHYFGFVVTTAA